MPPQVYAQNKDKPMRDDVARCVAFADAGRKSLHFETIAIVKYIVQCTVYAMIRWKHETVWKRRRISGTLLGASSTGGAKIF